MSAGRTAHFKVRLVGKNLDGKNEVSIQLDEHASGDDFTVTVWPKGSRVEYTGLLSDVALIVASRHVKALMQSQGKPVPRPRK